MRWARFRFSRWHIPKRFKPWKRSKRKTLEAVHDSAEQKVTACTDDNSDVRWYYAIAHAVDPCEIEQPEPPKGTIPTLPPEIIDIIIDHLHDDKVTLSSCSLVCRSWVQSSRFHLFRCIRILGTNPFIGQEPFDRLIDIRTNVPDLFELIRELHLFGWRENLRHGARRRQPLIPFACDTLVLALHRLPPVRVISLTGVAAIGNSLAGGAQPVPSLRFLNLDNSYFHFQEFSSFLSLFPNLTTLNTFKCKWGDPHNTREQVLSNSLTTLRLQYLSLTYPDDFILTLVRRSPSVGTLKSIDFTYVPDVSTSGLNALLEDSGPNLTHIGFGLSGAYLPPPFPGYKDPVELWEDCSFSSCISLESLRLGVIINSSNPLFRHHWTVVAGILSQISPTIITIVITIEFLNDWDCEVQEDWNGEDPMSVLLGDVDWSGIEDVVNGFPRLSTFRLLEMDRYDDYKTKKMREDRAELIRSRMPLLDVRRLLRFE